METEKSISEAVFVIVLIIVGITTWRFGYWSSTKNDIQDYKEDLKAKYAGTSLVIPEGTEVKRLSGTIKSINGQTLAVSISYPRDLLDDSALDERNVTLDDNSSIILLNKKDNEVFRKEVEEYQNQISASRQNTSSISIDTAGIAQPQIFNSITGTLLSLKTGQMINITTAENVRSLKSFIAKTIEVLPLQSAVQLDL